MSILLATMLAAAGPDARMSYPGLNRVAACVIRRDRTGAARFADAEPGSAQEIEAKAVLAPNISRCGEADGDRLAGMIAERFYRAVTYRPFTPPVTPEDKTALANLALNRMAKAPVQAAAFDCLVTLRPGSAGSLVSSRSGSDAERVAMQAIADSIGMCVAQGEHISLRPLDFRLGVARALFRRSSLADFIDRGG